MSLMSEIQALRAEIQALALKIPFADGNEDTASDAVPREPPADHAVPPHDVETFLELVNETLDEFADELDRFPKLTALAALGVGLAAGVVIGRQLR